MNKRHRGRKEGVRGKSGKVVVEAREKNRSTVGASILTH